tara:strand:+ start:13440 stop:14579 length:1140 start_codon:yes stop_codon:yes gene_type:complete
MDNKEKLNLDDISFDDFIDGGVATAGEEAVASELAVEETKEEPTNELDEDAAVKESGEEVEDIDTDDEEEEEVEETSNDSAADDGVEATESAEDGEIDNTVIGEVLTNLGYELEGDYADTVEGLTQMTQDVAQTMAEDQLDNLFEQFPEIQQHLEFVLNGGDSSEFYSQGNRLNTVANVNLTENNVNAQQAVLVEYFRVKGHDDSFIAELLEDYASTDKLYDKSVKAKEALLKYEQAQRAHQMEAQKQASAQQRQEAQNFWSNVSETIEESREFSGIVVQQKDKKKFFDYISQPVDKQGNTQRDLDHEGAEMDVRLAIDYLMFKGFKLEDMIKAKAKTETAKTLRKQIKRSTRSVKGAKGKGGSKSFDVDNLDLSLTSL